MSSLELGQDLGFKFRFASTWFCFSLPAIIAALTCAFLLPPTVHPSGPLLTDDKYNPASNRCRWSSIKLRGLSSSFLSLHWTWQAYRAWVRISGAEALIRAPAFASLANDTAVALSRAWLRASTGLGFQWVGFDSWTTALPVVKG